ncbi:(2Fe-2S) ferredoxin domain-containing protein [Nocardioides ferulae]|uniref:(2Fe-2S) ferredoxin domain-containing protein n=1 Tax=Nocardioides ferulae TaxID=2340821 RepID=UPI000EB0508C|nr:(2Fe-2S) ferredoxin domain-containing protein [Nocardioides ferulae]
MTVQVVVGTSPADAARRGELVALAGRVGAELAFLQLASPGLSEVLDRLAASGVERVVLVGVGDVSGPGVSWLRRVAADWWRGFGEGAPVVATASSFLVDEAEWAGLVARARPITDGGPGLRSPVWEEPPAHRHQVLVCRGPRCTAAGSAGTWRALVLALMAAGLGDDDVLVTQTGCLFPCNRAPVVSVQPDDVWYSRVDEAATAEVVAEHLVGGAPVARLRLRREPRDG